MSYPWIGLFFSESRRIWRAWSWLWSRSFRKLCSDMEMLFVSLSIYIFGKFLSGSDALFQRLFTCLYMSVSVILSCIFPNRFSNSNSNSSKQMLAGSVWSLSERTVLICWYRQSWRTKWELRNAKFKMLSYCDLCAFYWQSCSSSPMYPLWPGYWCNTGTVSCSSVLLNDGWNNCC